MITPVVAGKLIAGVVAIILAYFMTKNMIEPEKKEESKKLDLTEENAAPKAAQ